MKSICSNLEKINIDISSFMQATGWTPFLLLILNVVSLCVIRRLAIEVHSTKVAQSSAAQEGISAHVQQEIVIDNSNDSATCKQRESVHQGEFQFDIRFVIQNFFLKIT